MRPEGAPHVDRPSESFQKAVIETHSVAPAGQTGISFHPGLKAWAILLDRSAVIGKCPNSRLPLGLFERIHDMIKRFLVISAFCAALAFAQTPLPRLPLNPNDAVNVAKAKAWMIQLFRVPADAKITHFKVSAPGTRAFIMWDTFNDNGKPGHWGHTRVYDFQTRTILTWTDVDLMNPPR
jgi:hypothetical protein